MGDGNQHTFAGQLDPAVALLDEDLEYCREALADLAKRLGEKMATLFTKSKARRKISVGVKDIMSHLDEVTARCRRYKVDDIVANLDWNQNSIASAIIIDQA